MVANLGTVNDAAGTLSWPVAVKSGTSITVYITVSHLSRLQIGGHVLKLTTRIAGGRRTTLA